jgi:hypothetical protein
MRTRASPFAVPGFAARNVESNKERAMYDSYREVRTYPEVIPAKARKNGRETIERHALDRLLADQSGDDCGWVPYVPSEDGPARRPPCGGRCERFGVQGCHSPRCCVGAE